MEFFGRREGGGGGGGKDFMFASWQTKGSEGTVGLMQDIVLEKANTRQIRSSSYEAELQGPQ